MTDTQNLLHGVVALVQGISPRARSVFETYQMTSVYEVKAGKVQLMLYHCDLGKIGGLSTKPNGQYLLASPAHDIIGSPRLSQLGFELRHRSDGSPFWWKQGHNHLGGFITAVREITERHRLLAA
ncbi:hypothetical protein [Falsihalocynthiibacter arcticus]|uniref:Uncharacterized protein n=1 Tax=Falsihalocynthiibacter arcticus TaxID=1579316 RepID=A0A126UXM5_9RHOB|nr:hypothetical protein [Falsihalocynthiibacter arcticus]AML50189.1 hypothetical protein RC74_01925 [Falsihalocynthiibacter arcticus]